MVRGGTRRQVKRMTGDRQAGRQVRQTEKQDEENNAGSTGVRGDRQGGRKSRAR